MKINICFCIEEKMRGWPETYPAKYESRDGRALSRVGGISTSSARLYFGNFTMKVGKYENLRRESAEKKMLARVPPNSCPTHRVGPVLSAPHVHRDEERDRKWKIERGPEKK